MPLSRARAARDGLDEVGRRRGGTGVSPVGRQLTGDELGDDLGIGVAVEADALAFELALERGVVFDDAVVDDGDLLAVAEVRMGVAVVGGAVRGPACVADAGAAGGGLSRR